MAKELTLEVVARKNSRDLVTLADDFDRLRKSTDDSGKSMQKHATFSKFLDDQLAKTKVQVKQLGEEFDRTGSKDVFAALKGAERNVKSLETLKKQLSSAISDGAQEGSQKGVQFLGNAFGSLPPQAQAAIGAGIAGAVLVGAPVIGASITGVLLGAVGAAGIGTAIAIQAKDPAVSNAFKQLGTSLKLDLTEATSSFAPILIEGAGRFGSAFGRLEPVLESGFKSIAVPADHLFTGIGKFITNLGPGLADALKKSGVVLDRIGAELPQLGRDFSAFFKLIGDGSAGGADALGQLINGMGILVVATGAELDLLSKTFVALEVTADLASGKFPEAAQKIASLAGGFHDGKDQAAGLVTQLGLLGPAADGAAGPIGNLADKTLAFHNNAANAKLDSLEWTDSLEALKTQLQGNKGALDDHSAAGRQDEETYIRLAQQAQTLAEKVFESTGNSAAAATAFQQYKGQLDAAAVSAGATTGDVAKLNEALDNTVKVRKGSVELEINVTGNGRALVTQGSGTSGATTLLSGKGIKFYASGGQYQAGVPRIVGENGPELDIPDHSGVIIPKLPAPPQYVTRSAAAPAQSGRWVAQVQPGGDSLTAEFLHALERAGVLQFVRA